MSVQYNYIFYSIFRQVSLKPLNQEETEPIFIRMPSVKQSQEDILASSIEDLEVKEEIGKLKFLTASIALAVIGITFC